MGRRWWSLKYECVYLNVFEIGSEGRRGIGAWITDYNERRLHAPFARECRIPAVLDTASFPLAFSGSYRR